MDAEAVRILRESLARKSAIAVIMVFLGLVIALTPDAHAKNSPAFLCTNGTDSITVYGGQQVKVYKSLGYYCKPVR